MLRADAAAAMPLRVPRLVPQVDVSLYEPGPGGAEKLLVHGTGMYKRMGALRAM